MKKILYVISSLENSGPVKVLYNLIFHLNKQKYEVSVLALSYAKKNDLTSVFKSLGINVYVLNLSRLMFFIKGRRELSKFMCYIKPDIVHTQCFRSTLFMQYFATKVNLFTTIHCVFYQDFVFSYGYFLGSLMIRLYINALKKYDICIACSETAKRLLLEKYKLNLTYVRNGTQIPKAEHIKDELLLTKKRNALGITGYKKVFICTGRICIGKNQAQILRCLRKFDNICVIFLGNGPEFEKLRKSAPKNAIFLGNVNNVYDYLSMADGFISASFSEGMPNAVLEALMMGLPCILSNIEPHCEIKKLYPEACDLYKVNDDDDLVACFCEVIKREFSCDSYENISSKSRELFSSSVMSRKYQNIYDEFSLVNSLSVLEKI